MPLSVISVFRVLPFPVISERIFIVFSLRIFKRLFVTEPLTFLFGDSCFLSYSRKSSAIISISKTLSSLLSKGFINFDNEFFKRISFS